MRIPLLLLGLVACGVSVQADDPKPPEVQKDFADLSRLIHKVVVKELPKEFEDRSGWGAIVPLTEKLRFPNLPRTRVRIGDKEGYPNGLWKKYRVRIDDPAKDVKIKVREFSKSEPKAFRLAVDSEVALTGEGEIQNWQKGLALGKINAEADAVFTLGTVFDVAVNFNTKKFPPDLIIEPKLTDLQIDLKEFNLRKVTNPTTTLSVEGEAAKNIGDDLKETLRGIIRTLEPDIKLRANEAIAQSLREGKGNISASALMKIAPPCAEEREMSRLRHSACERF